jgi:polysaccharide pyruvyl transferase WcaK-like protein
VSDLHRPAHVPSVLIWGGWYGSRNIGDDAILLGLKHLIHTVNRGRDLYVRALSTDADQTSSFGVTGERALVRSELLKPWAWWRVLRIFARADRVIVSGGTPIFDSSHAIRTLYFLLPALMSKPLAMVGVGVKPIRSRYGRASVRWFVRNADYISVRDRDSQRILTELGATKVELTADSAFFAQPAPEPELRQLLAEYGIGEHESYIVVAPRLLSRERRRLYLQEEMDDTLIEETPARLAAIVDRLAQRADRIVVMAMHFHGPDSDVPLIRQVLARTRARNVTNIDRELTPGVAIALFQRAQLVVAVRLHALLLAASMETPVVGIAYEQKVKSLFENLGLEKFCHDLFNLDAEAVARSAEQALTESATIRTHLRARVGELRSRVLATAAEALRIPEP